MKKKTILLMISLFLLFLLAGCNKEDEKSEEEKIAENHAMIEANTPEREEVYAADIEIMEDTVVEEKEEDNELIQINQNDPFYMYLDDFNKGKEGCTNYFCVKKGEQYYTCTMPHLAVQYDDIWNYSIRYEYEYKDGSLIKEENIYPAYYRSTSASAGKGGFYFTNPETPILTVQKSEDRIIGCFKKDIMSLELKKVVQDGYTIPALIDDYYTFYEEGGCYYYFASDQYISREITDYNGNIIDPSEYGNYEKDKEYNLCLHMENEDYSVSLVADRPLYKTESEVAYSIEANPLGDGSYLFDIQDVEPGVYFAKGLGIIEIE